MFTVYSNFIRHRSGRRLFVCTDEPWDDSELDLTRLSPWVLEAAQEYLRCCAKLPYRPSPLLRKWPTELEQIEELVRRIDAERAMKEALEALL